MNQLRDLTSFVFSVMESTQQDYDGGLLAYMTHQNFSGIEEPLFWEHWSLHVLSKGSYIGLIVLGLVWAIILPLVFFVCWICFFRRCSCWGDTKRSLSLNLGNFAPVKQLEKTRTFCPCLFYRSARHVSVGRRKRRMYYVQMFAISLSLFIFLVVMITTFVVNGHLQEDITSETQKSALSNILNRTVTHFGAFVREGLDGAHALTNETVIAVYKDVNQTLVDGIERFLDDLLRDYHVEELFKTSGILLSDLNLILDTMEEIKHYQSVFIMRLNRYEGVLNYAKGELEARLPRVCQHLGTAVDLNSGVGVLGELYSQCRRLESKVSGLALEINQTKINFDSSNSLIFIIEKYKLNVTELEHNVNKAKHEMSGLLDQILGKIKKEMSLDMILNKTEEFWGFAKHKTNRFLYKLKPIKESKRLKLYMKYFSNVRIGIFIFPAAFLLCFLLIVLYLLYQSVRFIIEENKRIMNQEFSLQPLEELTNPVTPLNTIEGGRMYRHPHNAIHIITLIIIGLIIIPAVGVVVTFLAGGVMQTEVCRYFNTVQGRNITSRMVDELVEDNWEDLRAVLENAIGRDLPPFVNLEPPRDIFMGLTEKCATEKKVGLLNAFNIHRVINIRAALEMPEVASKIEMGREMAKDEIRKLDTNRILPNNILPIIHQARQLTDLFIDKISHEDTIKELQKSIMKLPDPPAYYNELLGFLTAVRRRSDSGDLDDVTIAWGLSRHLVTSLADYTKLDYMSGRLRGHFETLQNLRQMTSSIERLIGAFEKVRILLANKNLMLALMDPIYNRVVFQILSRLTPLVEGYLEGIELRLAPCKELFLGYSSFVNSTCFTFTPEFNAFTVFFGGSLMLFQLVIVVLYFHLKKVTRQQIPENSDC